MSTFYLDPTTHYEIPDSFCPRILLLFDLEFSINGTTQKAAVIEDTF